MKLKSPWKVRLSEGAESPHEALVSALAEDILEGRLEVGSRLPAHRDLAEQVSLGLGTVTKAYGVLERRGLVRSVKGRGMFVAATEARRGPLIDLSRNAPPAVASERLLARTLGAVAKRLDAGMFNTYPPVGGHIEHRRMLASWFEGLGLAADPARLVMTSGAHHAIGVALSVTCRGGTLLTEAQTYPGALMLAKHMGITVLGVEMDEEGMRPDALDRTLRGLTGDVAVYLTPTLQNPTAAVMSEHRRSSIAEVARRHDIFIIEDDVYSLVPETVLTPIASVAPERVFYANSMSKTLNPSLRIGGLQVPQHMLGSVVEALQASSIMVSPLSGAVMEQWFLDGTAHMLVRAIQQETHKRYAKAVEALGTAMRHSARPSYHVWLPMKGQEDARDFERKMASQGVEVTPVGSTHAGAGPSDAGVRLCVGAPSASDLEQALAISSGILAG